MNTKSSWVVLALVLLAVVFVPIIPNDVPITGCTDGDASCDESAGYISVYQKFLK